MLCSPNGKNKKELKNQKIYFIAQKYLQSDRADELKELRECCAVLVKIS
jgi:hypothetical protein